MVIAENDDARGVLQLSSSTYEAEESSQNFVTVSRGAGSFGTVRHATRTSLKLSLLSVSLPRGGHGFFACSCHGNDLIHMYTKFHL